MRIDRFKKGLLLLAVPVIIVGAWIMNVFSQTEVSTQIVGFVRDVDNDAGEFRFMSIPFMKLGSDGIKIHYLNKDDNGDGVFEGIHPSGTDAIFDAVNFSNLDEIKKLDPKTGTYKRTARLYTSTTKPVGFSGVWSGPGWYELIGIQWKLTNMFFADGEGFLVKYKIPPSQKPSQGTVTNFIGEFDSNSEVITPVTTGDLAIPSGYTLLGNPFPINLHLSEAFTQYPDNDATLPTPGTGGVNPPGSTPGDKIYFFSNTYQTWIRTAVYFNHPTKGIGWYAQKGISWYKITNNPNDTANYGTTKLNYSDWYLVPGKGHLYYFKTPFYWKAKAPNIN